TRSKTRHWKTGFYYIAHSAQVPILMAYMDYSTKRSGLGPLFEPTGDVEADMARIKAFYKPFKGKNAAQFESEDA
ncbi:MAG: glycerol acyltransferase, partial [Serpentinimonas sp.]|nr:glycerol acyltransferase [Serpentinimonas sp.]